MCFLYGRSFESAGLPTWDKIDASLVDVLNDQTQLPKEYLVKCKSGILTDIASTTWYSSEELKTKVWSEKNAVYFGIRNPMLPMEVTPKNMVSYAGTTGDLADSFPKVHYTFVTPNTLWLPDKPDSGPEFYTYQQQVIEDNGNRLPLLGGYLADKGKYYDPWRTPDAPADLDLDPDGDWLPFKEGFSANGQPAVPSQGGQYSIALANQDNISQIGFYYYSAQMAGIAWNNPWHSLGYFYSTPPLDPVNFYSVFQSGDMIVRPTSGDLTVAPVVAAMPATPSKPTAVIDAGATYQDSTEQALAVATVSLLNDNKEPTKAIYDEMLAIVSSNDATKGKTYQHHYLSLLNVADGNNVVITNTAKTVYIPYPNNYKKGSAITLLHFADYHRMPNETVDGAKTAVIADADITKLDEGFTFTTTGNMGAYIIAYDKASAPITPPDPIEPPVTPPDPDNPPVTPPDQDNPPVTPPDPDKLPVTPTDPDEPPLLPQTGDVGALPWGVVAVCSGLVLVFICNKRKKADQE